MSLFKAEIEVRANTIDAIEAQAKIEKALEESEKLEVEDVYNIINVDALRDVE